MNPQRLLQFAMNPKVMYLATHPRQALFLLGGFLLLSFAAVGGIIYLLTDSLLTAGIILGGLLVILLGAAFYGVRKGKALRAQQQEQMKAMMQLFQGGMPGFGVPVADSNGVEVPPPGALPLAGMPDPATLSKMFESLNGPATREDDPPVSKS